MIAGFAAVTLVQKKIVDYWLCCCLKYRKKCGLKNKSSGPSTPEKKVWSFLYNTQNGAA